MKLSEAIRLGAMMGPQCFEQFTDVTGGTCALGAAGKAVGESFEDLDELSNYWPWLWCSVTCPECGGTNATPVVIGDHLNDMHRWTRERIADWVATVEPEDALKEVATESVEVSV